ncbi:MAG: glycosyltransferase family 39 protein [Lewinellaceae bacterium]|nr:glycosyltransferase family 39 protein [Lewinellaceae bacterium]
MQRIRPFIIFLLFLGIALLLRFFSFFPSVINHDESTYIVISDAILAGHTYQVDYIDTKPIGIFLIYAFLQLLMGKSVLLLRVAAAATLAATAYFLYRAKLSFGSRQEAAFASGLAYLFLNSIFTYFGVSPNTETFFNLFTALALWVYCSRPPVWAYFIAGLSLGIGFVIKYVVLFDGLAFGLFLLWQARLGKEKWGAAWAKALAMAAGAALPFLAVIAWYRSIGHLEPFWFYTFTVSGRYLESKGILDHLAFFLDFNLRFLPVAFFFYYVVFSRMVHSLSRQFGLLWAALVLLGVLLPGKLFGHYFIQFMLPFCFLAGEFFSITREALPKGLRWLRRPKIGYPLLGLLLLTNLVLQYKDYYLKTDYPRQSAAFLAPRLSPGDVVYTANDQIIYHLLGTLPPLPYVHPSLFWEEQHIRALEIGREAEIERLKAKQPRFLLFRNPEYEVPFRELLENEYRLTEQIADRVNVYERLQ